MQLVSHALLPLPHGLAISGAAGPPDSQAMRQLRHLSGNAWQRVLCEVWKLTGPNAPVEVQALATEIERRITHAVALSDALFGLTRQPGSLAGRLRALCDHTLELMADIRQEVGITVRVQDPCPDRLELVVLRMAQEMVSNAVKHGLHARLRGQLTVTLTSLAKGGVALSVGDDGWGAPARPEPGEGLSLLRQAAEERGGAFSLRREGSWTVARLELP